MRPPPSHDERHLPAPPSRRRQIAEKLIDIENQERRALIQALADSNHRRDAEPEIWELMRERWHKQWKSGWWLRDAEGKWSRKP